MESVVYAFMLIALIGGVVVGYVAGSMTCPNQGLELESQLSELQERIAAQDIQIEGLQEEIDEAHSWMTLSIDGIEWDVPSGRIAVLAKNGEVYLWKSNR